MVLQTLLKFAKGATIPTSVLLAASALANVCLGITLHRDQALMEAHDGPLVGQTVPSIEAMNPNGRIVSIRFADVSIPTVLYVFRPGCGWCLRNMANMRSLIAQQGQRYRLVLLSLQEDGLDPYRQEGPFLVVTPGSQRAYALGSTPQTLVVSPDGVLRENWFGAYTTRQPEIERALSIVLPGLNPMAEKQ